MANTCVVLQEQVKAGGRTQLHHCWRCESKDHGVAEASKMLLSSFGQRKHAQLWCGALFPRFQTNKGQTCILSAPGKVEAGNREHRVHRLGLLLQQIGTHCINRLLSALGARTHRRLHLGIEYALIFVRQEGGWQAGKQKRHQANNHQIQQQVGCLALQDRRHAVLVARDATIKRTVKPAEETTLLVRVPFLDRLENGRAQRRRKDQRHQHRQQHR